MATCLNSYTTGPATMKYDDVSYNNSGLVKYFVAKIIIFFGIMHPTEGKNECTKKVPLPSQ
jgi:hypothetical protein